MGKIADRFSKSKRKKAKRTGHCFVTAATMQSKLLTDWELVHGIPLGKGGEAQGLRYPHAWLESPDGLQVFDPSLYEKGIEPFFPLRSYYEIGNIEWTVRYPVESATRLMHVSGNFGPWHQKLIDLDREIG